VFRQKCIKIGDGMTKGSSRAFATFALTLLALGALFSGWARSAPFTHGNLVVYRIGISGGATLAATGNPVFLDEYTSAGVLVQSIAMPTTASGGNYPFAASGTATSDGLLTRSADGKCLLAPGYGRDPADTAHGNITSGTTNGTTAVPRVVGVASVAAVVDTTTALTDAATGGNFRGAASNDCSGLWTSGSVGGVRYASIGATTSTSLTPSVTAVRGIAVFGGQLYLSTNSGTNTFKGVSTVGTGTPSTGSLTVTRLPGLTDTNSPSTYGLFLADLNAGVAGVDTLYVADDSTGALSKFSLVGGTWTLNGTIGVAADSYRGLTGIVSGSSVVLYATRKNGELVSLVDSSGYNGAFAGTPTLLASAASNTVFRGVALAPEVQRTVTPSVGPHGTINPSTPQTVYYGTQSVFTITPDSGYVALVGGTCGGTLVGNTYTTSTITADCTVGATFSSAPSFTVTPSATAGGTISPNTPQTVLSGATPSFTVTPSAGFSASVGGSCGGGLAGTTFTTSAISADCTVAATFTQITYTMTPSAGAHGTISPSIPQTVNALSQQVFTVTPNSGFLAAVGGSCGGTLVGTAYTTNAASANCTVDATFTALPTYTVTLAVVGNGAVSPPTSQTIFQNATASFTPTPAGGNSVVMTGCGGTMSAGIFTTGAITADCTVSASFSQKNILFVGNSYTFGRVDPALTYNAANVTDLTAAFNALYPNGTNSWPWSGPTCTGASSSDGCFEQHPWGGVPGIFKALTVQAGLNYNVSSSTRNAATLRGHFLNTANSVWNLRSNIASQKWDVVTVQGQSDEPLPANMSKNGNPAAYKTYANQIAKYVHQGNGLSTDLVTTEQAIYAAEGFGTSSSTTARTIPPNPNANPSAKIYVMQNWARPDMVESHKCTVPDYSSTDGAPLADPTCASGANGSAVTGQNNIFYTVQSTTALNLNDITNDMNASNASLLANSNQFFGVIPVGNAFQRAVNGGVVKNSGFYNVNGTYDDSGLAGLWWLDRTHGNKYGSYLSALVHFAKISEQDPTQFGAGDSVASGLGIASGLAVTLQQIARATVVPAAPAIGTAVAGDGQASVNFTPPSNIGGLPITGYTATCGSQTNTGLTSPIIVSGLVNGIAVICTVVASNSVGAGFPSSDSNNVTPGPNAMTLLSGDGQSAAVNTTFGTALAVTVLDVNSNPVSGVNATFTAPGSGASGKFSNTTATITVATNGSGVAAAPFTANAAPGGPYTVTAAAAGLTTVNFSLCNNACGPTVTSVAPASGSTAGGTSVTITGTNLGSATGVTIGGNACTPLSDNTATSVTCNTPSGGAGTASVLVTTAGGTNVANTLFAYTVRQTPPINTAAGGGTVVAQIVNGSARCSIDLNNTTAFTPPPFNGTTPPYGGLKVKLTGCNLAETVQVSVTWPSMAGLTFQKYGPTPTSGGSSIYYTPNNLSIAGNVVTYSITDNGLGDDTFTGADGVINDPAVPVSFEAIAAGIPTLSEWGMIALSGLLALCTLVVLRRRRM
jgi:hypothetical protein